MSSEASVDVEFALRSGEWATVQDIPIGVWTAFKKAFGKDNREVDFDAEFLYGNWSNNAVRIDEIAYWTVSRYPERD